MGYQALLFCPDEKTARTVTQVLNELEFTVEPCIEPFAAVKKLMGQHFDAVVVDCDNEQNATLLFKSARNSTSNQASLAVAVVEGQAGVAKAFRIGANLVLTKPINIEQTKGTLRVARGLLRKGDPAKPAASAPAAAPAKPIAAKPASPAKPAAPATPAVVSTPRPAAPSPAWPATPAASSATAAHHSAASDDDVLEISLDASAAAPPDDAPVFNKFGAPTSQAAKLPAAAIAGLPATHGSGAASAPAPAREVPAPHIAETSPAHTPAPAEVVVDKPAEAAQSESSSYAGSAPSFTFGGANAPEKSSGGRNKIFLGIAAAAIVGAALYVGWTKFQGRESQPASTSTQVTPAPVAAPQAVKPSSAKPAPTIPTSSAGAPTSSAKVPSSQPNAVSAKGQAADDADSASDDTSVPSSTKPSSSPSASKTDAEPAPAAAPLMVKRGTAPATHAKTAASDEAAPSMIGIATAGAGAPPPDLGSSASSAPKPVLQTLNISQGVSQGLLLKKVQPAYPRNAILMRVEGAVELMATISRTGDITHIKIVSGDSQLTRAAAEAVKQWKYKPYLLNGEPVEIQTQVTINFKLPK